MTNETVATYQILDIRSVDETISRVRVEVAPVGLTNFNGLTRGTIEFDVPNDELEQAIKKRVLWKIEACTRKLPNPDCIAQIVG